MGNYVKVGNTGEFNDGTKKKISVEGQEILLTRVDGKYYAVSNRCPHMGGDLSAGTLEASIITCPRHGSQFDVRDGKNIRWMRGSGLFSAMGKAMKSPRPIQTYNVKVEGDTILVEV